MNLILSLFRAALRVVVFSLIFILLSISALLILF
jgi:hypothetical protein